MAYFDDGLWLDMAGHSNAMADRLRAGLDASANARQGWPTQSNEIFAVLKKPAAQSLRAAGAVFYDWNEPHEMPGLVGENEMLARLVTSWSTTPEDVDAFCERLG